MWWHWVVGVLVVWLVVAIALALLIGRGIRLADRRSPGTGVALTADLPASSPTAAPSADARSRCPRSASPGRDAVALETCGFVLRRNGSPVRPPTCCRWTPPSLCRACSWPLLFAAAAFAAVVAAGRMPGRRTWWLAVAVVAGGIASVKAGGTVHADAIGALNDALGARAAVLLSVLAAAVVVAGLWSFTRTERRDRRRVLGTLGFYAVASVGLSAVSAAVPGSWAVTATFVEESGEALAGVAFLMAVLVGVAPRWCCRRLGAAPHGGRGDPRRAGGAARSPRPKGTEPAGRPPSARARLTNQTVSIRSRPPPRTVIEPRRVFGAPRSG